VVLLPFSFCFVGCIVGSGFCCCCGGFIVWREELEGLMGKEEEGMPNTCVRGCCSSTHIPLAIPKTHFNITKEIARGSVCLSVKGFPNYCRVDCSSLQKKEERFDKMLVMGDGCQGLRVWYMKLDWKGSL
jgi:hypothetical protein